MTFDHPATLWLLALALPVIAVHFYRGRRRLVGVPSLAFWEQVIVEEERRSALRRLRQLLALVVALAALAMLVSAVAGPSIAGVTPVPRRFVLLVDTSGAMRAGDRIPAARKAAQGLLDRLGRLDEAAIFDSAGLVIPPTTHRGRWQSTLDSLPRSIPDLDPEQVRAAALSMAGSPDGLFVFSCRPGERVVPIGRPIANRALAGPSHSAPPGAVASTPRTVRVRAINQAAEPARVDAVLRDRGEEVARQSIDLPAGGSRAVEWTLPAAVTADGALLEMSLEPRDDFPQDDIATLVLPPLTPPLVALVGADPDPHLLGVLQVLAAEGEIRLAMVRTPAEARGQASVTIVEGTDPEPLGPGGTLVVDAPGRFTAESPVIVDWSRDAPFHRHVDYADVRLRRANVLEGSPLILSDKGPIATWGARMGHAWIRFGFSFRVSHGDIALRPAFPLIIRDAIQWLAGPGTRAFAAEVSTGSVLVNERPLPAARGEAQVTDVAGPDVRISTHPVEDSRVTIPVDRPGLLKITADGREEWVAANDPLAGTLDLGRVAEGEGPRLPEPIRWWRDLPWAPVAGAVAAVLLLLEWLLARPS